MKTPRQRLPRIASASQQRGFVMIISLLFLIVLTVLSISMFRSFDLQEKIAGNTLEKQRALETAQSALQYGEWWLGQGNGGTGSTCNAATDANTLSQMQVCSNALATPTTLPWTARADYLPPNMLAPGGGGLATSGDINYYKKPGLYINYLGLAPDGRSLLYRVSAFGYGGRASTAAVVQSTYQITGGNKALDQP
ncbi:PilX N-terminal domain-containing pilus assembly protein [Variovorax sp. Sphag1AA]|uniref:pilus assembly PilX family protein n=1 Tax=Variovorax sp. Sphag1AA TaxID=2587027 RepID=UPI001612B710|nr:pilus assembly protein [Variovorax sp. Sphag1AA]MBB3180505.1 type IV pilus assembly protein PilX [Variovorax sp. Sphag1AA]